MRRANASALALALVLLPACTESLGAAGPSGPTSTGTPATTDAAVVRRVDLQVRYVLEGISEEGPAVAILWDPRLVFVPSRRPGEEVEAGDVLGRSRIAPDLRRTLATGARTSSIDASVLAELRSHEGRIFAPIAGTLALESGRPLIRAPGIDVVSALLPVQYLRYRSIPFSGRASIETVIGQRSLPCAALWVESSGGGTPYELHCRLPAYAETAAGLRARIVLSSKIYRDAVVVPNLFVGYDRRHDGYYVNIVEDGRVRKVPITVGITDGVVRIVTSDLPVGAMLAPPSDG